MNILTYSTVVELSSGLQLANKFDLLDMAWITGQHYSSDRNNHKLRDAEVLALISASTKGNILELGTEKGYGTCQLANNLAEGTVYTVDFLEEQVDSRWERIKPNNSKNIVGEHYRELQPLRAPIVQIFANTLTWSLPAELDKISVAIVDACHEYECVYSDTKLVATNIVPGGFILWHDFCPSMREEFFWINNVMRAVDTYIQETDPYLDVHYLKDSWFGISRP